MKNFYDLQDIDTDIELVITLNAITDNGIPHAKIICNNKVLLDTDVDSKVIITEKLDLMNLINISVTLSKKLYSNQKETALVIDSIFIDGNEIIPKYNHCVLYDNDHNLNVTTNYLGWNGTWSLCMDKPFYRWLHQQSNNGWLLNPHEKKPQKDTKRY